MFGVGMLLAKIAKSTHARTDGHEKIEGPTQGAPKGATRLHPQGRWPLQGWDSIRTAAVEVREVID